MILSVFVVSAGGFDWHLSAAPAPPLNFVSFTDTDPDAGEVRT